MWLTYTFDSLEDLPRTLYKILQLKLLRVIYISKEFIEVNSIVIVKLEKNKII